jgi:hypothetical protein
MENKDIEKLNQAYYYFAEALKIVKDAFPNDNDVDYYYWKMDKLNQKMHQYLVKKFQQEMVDEEFEKMIKKLRRNS